MPNAERSPPSRGTFITFEGGEGSGKTTQIRRLAEALSAAGLPVVTTREPGGSPGADALRHVILTGAAEPLGNDMEAILFAAARLDHLQTRIEPALARGEIVLCDRFHDSTRVYQGGASGADPEFMAILEEATLSGTRPDLTVILDLPAEEGLRRAGLRRVGETADRFEKEDVVVHEARRQLFLEIARREPTRCRVVEAGRPADEVAKEIRELVFERLAIGAVSGSTAGDGVGVNP